MEQIIDPTTRPIGQEEIWGTTCGRGDGLGTAPNGNNVVRLYRDIPDGWRGSVGRSDASDGTT